MLNKANSVLIELPSNVEYLTKVAAFVRGLNIMGKYIFLSTNSAAIAGLTVSIMGNMNKVIIINSFVVVSFDSDYQVGSGVYWEDMETIIFKE